MTVSIEPGVTEPHHAGGCHPAKWAALVDDVLLPMPRRQVTVGVIKDQAGLGPEFVLVRDHNSPEDEVLADDGSVDLAEGNVFGS